MSNITAQEWELLACFAVEPTLLDPDLPWCDNDAAYLVDVDDLAVSFAVQPSYKDIRLIVRRSGRILFELNAVAVVDVWIWKESGVDIIEVKISSSTYLLLQLRPTLRITQGSYKL